MKRIAFKMKLKPGCEAEYKKRHDEIWPQLPALLTESGITDYSVFLDEETLTLLAVHKLSGDNSAADLSASPLVKKWWDYMADLVETNADNSPVCIPLKEVYHMD
ncbi:MAG: L-rhamnose mutarotase [Verrucomicrobiae bacterium]|nr:L-rhamnose mutarotase [Verrucomicrobiae bacterium]NNJ86358.1 L-rhamnose mutarotase [Akkermansiaceae bacterium]